VKADSLTWKLVVSVLLSGGCSGGQAGPPRGIGGQGGIVQPGGGGQGGSPQAGTSGQAGNPQGGGSGQGAAGAAGSGGSTGAGGSAGDGAGTGGGAPAGEGTPDGSAGTDAAPTGQDAGDGAAPSGGGPFTCNMVFGMFTTSQWFNGSNPGGASKTFLQQDGIDPTKWQAKLQKYSYAEKWADPGNGVWSIKTANLCAKNTDSPDRALFVFFSPDTKHDQPTAQGLVEKVIANIRTKYPTIKQIDLLSMGRAPNNMMCPNNSDQSTVVGAYLDDAFQAIADASNGTVKVGPKYYVPDCNNSYIFANDTDYTTTAANYIAIEVATYYAAHP
jgi:hypothetical protein